MEFESIFKINLFRDINVANIFYKHNQTSMNTIASLKKDRESKSLSASYLKLYALLQIHSRPYKTSTQRLWFHGYKGHLLYLWDVHVQH
jgi:hypothetical protein